MLKPFFPVEAEDPHPSWITRIRKNPYQFLVALLVLVNLVLVMVNAGLWISAARQKLFVRADFTSFYTGYYLVRTGQGANLYDVNLQAQYQRQFMQGIEFEGGVLLFPNPPYVAIAGVPLAFLPLEAAFYTWTMIQLVVLIWLLVLLNRAFSHWDGIERLILVITILAFWPLTYNLLLGQFSILMLLGLVQFYLSMKTDQPIRSGIWMSLLAIKPHSLPLPGMMLLNRRYWRSAVTALVAGLVLFGASLAILGIKPWIDYLGSLRALGSFYGTFGVTPASEYTFRGVLANLLGNAQGRLTNLISLSVFFMGMILVWWLWRRGIPQQDVRFTLYASFAFFLSVFFNLHLNPHDALLLVLPAALFYDYLRQNGYPRRVYALLLLVSPAVFITASFSKFNLFGVIRPPVLLILIALIWCGYYVIKRVFSSGDATPAEMTLKTDN